MIFLLGVYSVLMMAIFPGAIFLKAFKFKKIQPFLPICFGLSLLINYFLVLGLTLLHGYIPLVVRSLGIIEGLVVIVLYYQSFYKKITLPKVVIHDAGILFYLAWICFIAVALYWLSSIGNVFGIWDPSVWYNRWALQWAQNIFPTLAWHYPQLLPSNWSLSYVMMGPLPDGVHLEAFAASIQGFFLVGMLYFLLSAFYQVKDKAFLLCLILLSIGLGYYYTPYLVSGYADIPVCFFSFAGLMMFLLEEESLQDKQRMRILALLFVLAAALTKPAGIYAAIVIPLLYYFADGKNRCLKALFWKYLILVIFIAPWYVYASLHETNHFAFADVLFLIHGIFQENGLFQTILQILVYGIFLLIFLILSFVFQESLSSRLKLALYGYTPYFFIWIFLFSYDERNLLLLWPVVTLTASFIFCHDKMFQAFLKQLSHGNFKKIPLWLPFGICVLAVISLNFAPIFQKESLINSQISHKNSAYDAEVMTRLWAYSLCPGFQGKVLTDYTFFAQAPLLKPYIVPIQDDDYGTNMEPTFFENPAKLDEFMQSNPNIHYFLLNRRYQNLFESPAFDAELSAWIKSGKARLKFSVDQVELYQISTS